MLSFLFHADLLDYARTNGWRLAMRQFVPMTDDMLENAGQLPGPLVPYQCGVPCWHRLRAEPERPATPLRLPAPTAANAIEAGALLNA
jgi:hypothetical protein